jgi:cleavage stimulation factor subunit 3
MYLAFETRVGDLASITKVDKRRRDAVAKDLGHALQTVLLIDRYKFIDLVPTSNEQLKVLGYKVRVGHVGCTICPCSSVRLWALVI